MTKEQIEEQMHISYDEGYKAGRSETIKKTIEWLKSEMREGVIPYFNEGLVASENCDTLEEFIEKFIKAIETQQ